jgi:hypothetical protein
MAGFSTYLANAIINNTLLGQAMPSIPGRFFALFTSDPTDAFTAGTEVSAGWYARKSTGSFASPTTGSTFNISRVEFDPVSGTSVTITHVGIVDAVTGGNLLYSEALTTPKTLAVNDVFVIDSATLSGDFTVTLL